MTGGQLFMGPRVLILGAEPRVVVTVARSISSCHRRWAFSGRSQACLPQPREDRNRFLGELSHLIQSERCSMLIPSTDTGLTGVAVHYEALSALLHVSCPPPAVVRQVLNKDQTLQVAQKCGIAIPTTYAVYERARLWWTSLDFRHVRCRNS